MDEKVDLSDVSFLMPVRIESSERLENIKAVITYILRYFKTTVFVLEADDTDNGLLKQGLSDSVNLIFMKDDDPIFHKTKYVNKLVKTVKTPIIAVWDADVVVNWVQIQASVMKLRNEAVNFIFPYDGRLLETGFVYRSTFINRYDIKFLEDRSHRMAAPYTLNACGGGFFADRKAYIIAGMENENLRGWGPEDIERLNRWLILQLRIGRTKGPMFHLSHPRGVNSTFKSAENKTAFYSELERIRSLSKAELQQEIRTWSH